MGSTALMQLLKSFCSNSHWKYAVFWKLKHQSQTILTWEDGYCDYGKPREPVENMSDDICFEDDNEIFSSTCETNVVDGAGLGYQIGLALADMSFRQYAMGEGVVGEVAYTGNHCWVLSKYGSSSEINSRLVPEYPDEWLPQFAAGIKTILLVPVAPYGVLQLGSLEWVSEDLALVAYVRDRFNILHNFAGINVPFTSNKGIQSQTSSLIMSDVLENLREPSDLTISVLEAEDLNAFRHSKPYTNKLSTLNEAVPASMVQEGIQVSRADVPRILGGANKNITGVSPNGLIDLSTSLHQSINSSQLEMLESKLFGLSCLDESRSYSQFNNYKNGVFEETSYGINPLPDVFMIPGETSAYDAGHNTESSLISFPINSELHKALGQAFQRHADENLYESSFSVEDSCSRSSITHNIDFVDAAEPASCAKGDDDADYLLEAIVASVSSCLDDTLTNRSNSARSSTTLSGQCADSFQSHCQSEASTLMNDDSDPWRHLRSSFASRDRSAFNGSVSSDNSSGKSMDKQQQEKHDGCVQRRKGTKLSSVSKRRARVGENQKPRPRDRQMIQDRLKELRQLVPNGAKFSIDGLLDQAVKHMLHLRSITEQAEKLRQLAQRKEADPNNWGSSETRNGSQNGTSWALELGEELQSCPIIVEDLEYPGHMLIEMLCNEHGLFLEIAQVIRHLEFTILKGKTDNRGSDSWAHFVVEGPKGFHRMDIFWALMHLWQCRRKPISSKF